MESVSDGYYETTVSGLRDHTLYTYRLDQKKDLPDPASRLQPQGVHGPSQVTDPAFPWNDRSWSGLPLDEYILYELHTGAFTSAGTFAAVIPHLDRLRALGVTAVELMPVAEFPGKRNWGYDGTFPFAAHHAYGGPFELKQLVNACHKRGLALVLDVVYNHLGPEGNYLSQFGPYYTDRYHTPWGASLNFDDLDSDEVRRYFIENALYWIEECHVDALRLDALHALYDFSARPFLVDLTDAVRECGERLGRRVYLIGEDDRNDAGLLRSPLQGGYGIDAQWNDDFHHALHSILTGERLGYYQDFGTREHLVRSLRGGFVYSGQFSQFRRRRYGSSSQDIAASRLIIFSQNHDQVGNRTQGDRLSHLVSFEALKLAAACAILTPGIPLLFMGEEYAEISPFLYFVSHTDPGLIEAVREGRKREFASFGTDGIAPDPQEEATFLRSKLDHRLRFRGRHRIIWGFYQKLLELRKTIPALTYQDRASSEVTEDKRHEGVITIRRWTMDDEVFVAFNFGASSAEIALPGSDDLWECVLDSAEKPWREPRLRNALAEVIATGELAPTSCKAYRRRDAEPWQDQQ